MYLTLMYIALTEVTFDIGTDSVIFGAFLTQFSVFYGSLWLCLLIILKRCLFSLKCLSYISRSKGMVYLYSWKNPNKMFCSKLARYLYFVQNSIFLYKSCCLTLLPLS